MAVVGRLEDAPIPRVHGVVEDLSLVDAPAHARAPAVHNRRYRVAGRRGPVAGEGPRAVEDAVGDPEGVDQAVDVGFGVVDVEAGAGGGDDAEAGHQWLGAVVAGPDRDVLAVEDAGDVVGVDVGQGEGDDAAAVRRVRRAVDRHAGHLGQPLQGIADDLLLVGQDAVHPQIRQVFDRRRRGRSRRRRPGCRPRTWRGPRPRCSRSTRPSGSCCRRP